MKRLTEKHVKKNGGYFMKCSEYCEREETMCLECERLDEIVDRLGEIEDILGDEYDLERMRLLLENDKSCYTCKNYKGEKICGFKGLDVEINPQEGCSVRKAALRREQDG